MCYCVKEDFREHIQKCLLGADSLQSHSLAEREAEVFVSLEATPFCCHAAAASRKRSNSKLELTAKIKF